MTARIDAYLDELDRTLTVSARQRRRIVEEARDHLIDAAARLESNGLPPAAAEGQALADFGPVSTIALGFDPKPSVSSVGAAIALHITLVAALAMVAVGLSGALAGGIGVLAGPATVTGAAPEGLTASDCARLAATEPGSRTCSDAWAWHALEESVLYRGMPGVLGVLVGLGMFWTARRHLSRTAWARRTSQLSALAGAVGFTTLCALACGAAIGLEPGGLPQVTNQATGWWLSWVLGSAAAAIASVVAYAAAKRGIALAG